MSLWMIAWRSVRQRGVASALTILSMALGVTLVVAVLVIKGVVGQSFQRNSELSYNLIVGPKSGRLALVLNTVYHLGISEGKIPYTYYQEFLTANNPDAQGRTEPGRFSPYIDTAIPICVGDNYRGYRVIGTVPELFDLPYGQANKYVFASGQNFRRKDFFTGIVGAVAAQEAGLKVGDFFEPTHGVSEDGLGHKHDAFKVVGVLAPTGTPNDRAIYVNIEGFYLQDNHAKPLEDVHADHDHDHAHDHDHEYAPPAATAEATPAATVTPAATSASTAETTSPAVATTPAAANPAAHDDHDHDHAGHDHAHHDHGHVHSKEPLPIAQRELSAILVRTKPLVGVGLQKQISDGPVAQAVYPIREIAGLMDSFVVPFEWLMLGLTILICLVAGISILVSIYNSMNERRREIAIMRALGASRQTVLIIVLLESLLLSLAGGLIGWLLGHLLLQLLNPAIVYRTGVSVGLLHFVWTELLLVPGLILLSVLVGYWPAITAYRTDVARHLSQSN